MTARWLALNNILIHCMTQRKAPAMEDALHCTMCGVAACRDLASLAARHSWRKGDGTNCFSMSCQWWQLEVFPTRSAPTGGHAPFMR